jgi:histidyl-tRNA synthetase
MRLQAPRGTSDVRPGDARRRLALQADAAAVLGRAGYEPFETPIFEDTELFARGVGEATDIVQKEMFTFEDKAGRSLTLRPEGTAGICRAYAEHGMHKLAQPVKLWYWGPFFRHEAPQAGRFRQFTQVGAEALGSDDPSLDAELILLLAELIERAGAGPARLRVSSLGTSETRAAYLEELAAYLRAREDRLSDEVRERLGQNPLRAFDADHPGTREVMQDAPRLLDRLEAADAEHFSDVRALLDAAGMPYEVDSTLVRGLDYYTRTVFEFESERLGAQAALGGGGRYDRLVEELGGPATPGVGWAAGIERILLASEAEAEAEPRVYVALARPDRMPAAFDLARRLRDEGIRVEIEQAGRSLKGQLKQADRIGARTTVILGDSMDVKDMDSGEQREAADLEELFRLTREAFAKGAPS